MSKVEVVRDTKQKKDLAERETYLQMRRVSLRVTKRVISYVGYLWFGRNVRLSDLVGLDCLLGVCRCAEDVEPKLLGIPSLIPSIPSSNPPPEIFLPREESLRGSGKLDSGPASPCRCSRLLRLLTMFILLVVFSDRDMSEVR